MTPEPVAGVLRLVPLTTEHLPAATAMLTDPDVLRFTRVPEPMPPSFPQTWFRSYEVGRRDGTKEAFAIVDAGEDGFLGMAVAPHIDREAKTLELGYTVAPDARGRGVASGALGLLTRWGSTTSVRAGSSSSSAWTTLPPSAWRSGAATSTRERSLRCTSSRTSGRAARSGRVCRPIPDGADADRTSATAIKQRT